MDLHRVAQKIQSNAYTSLDEMVKDLNLIVQNAKTFNEPGSQVYKVCVCVCGMAWRGVAWRGVAWRGVAWRGVVCVCV